MAEGMAPRPDPTWPFPGRCDIGDTLWLTTVTLPSGDRVTVHTICWL